MTDTIDTARLVAAFEKIATSPQALAIVERAAAGSAKAPVSAKLAGVKTYIVAGLGALSSLLVVADAFVQHGGLTLNGWLFAIMALVTSTGFATMRAAVAGHYAELAGMLLSMGQSIALEVVQSQAPAVAAEAAITVAPAVVAGAAGAVIAAPSVVVSTAAEAAGDMLGGIVGGVGGILGAATAAVGAPLELHPKA